MTDKQDVAGIESVRGQSPWLPLATLADKKSKDAVVCLDYIGRFGPQNIGVCVDGTMTVDLDTVPASIRF